MTIPGDRPPQRPGARTRTGKCAQQQPTNVLALLRVRPPWLQCDGGARPHRRPQPGAQGKCGGEAHAAPPAEQGRAARKD
eukprot:3692481-Amphidinium_carterae.2